MDECIDGKTTHHEDEQIFAAAESDERFRECLAIARDASEYCEQMPLPPFRPISIFNNESQATTFDSCCCRVFNEYDVSQKSINMDGDALHFTFMEECPKTKSMDFMNQCDSEECPDRDDDLPKKPDNDDDNIFY